MWRVCKRWWFWLAAVLVAAGNTLVGLCWWHHVWSWEAWQVYQAMDMECHPAWRDYHYGRVKAGDPVDDVIARTNPVSVKHKGRWTFLGYNERDCGYTGMGAVAYDGKMVFAVAMSCCWTRLFIDDLTEAQSLQLLGRSNDDPARLGHPLIRPVK